MADLITIEKHQFDPADVKAVNPVRVGNSYCVEIVFKNRASILIRHSTIEEIQRQIEEARTKSAS